MVPMLSHCSEGETLAEAVENLMHEMHVCGVHSQVAITYLCKPVKLRLVRGFHAAGVRKYQ